MLPDPGKVSLYTAGMIVFLTSGKVSMPDPERRHGSTNVVYIYCKTAAGNSISLQLGSSCQGNRYGT